MINKKAGVVALVLALSGCSNLPSKVNSALEKVISTTEKVQAKAECLAKAVTPAAQYLTDDSILSVLSGESDGVSLLPEVVVAPDVVKSVTAAVKACK